MVAVGLQFRSPRAAEYVVDCQGVKRLAEELSPSESAVCEEHRDLRYLNELMADREWETKNFLRSRSDPNADGWDPLYPIGYQPQSAPVSG